MPVEYSRIDEFALITLNRPEALNALSVQVVRDIGAAIDQAAQSDARALLITGAGEKAFCAGADISQFKDKRSSEDAVAEYNAAVQTASDTLAAYKLPTIAKIRGYCVGGGVGIAICCDLRIASDDSRFAVPAAKLGLGYRIEIGRAHV